MHVAGRVHPARRGLPSNEVDGAALCSHLAVLNRTFISAKKPARHCISASVGPTRSTRDRSGAVANSAAGQTSQAAAAAQAASDASSRHRSRPRDAVDRTSASAGLGAYSPRSTALSRSGKLRSTPNISIPPDMAERIGMMDDLATHPAWISMPDTATFVWVCTHPCSPMRRTGGSREWATDRAPHPHRSGPGRSLGQIARAGEQAIQIV
jgi:hypothetical protein